MRRGFPQGMAPLVLALILVNSGWSAAEASLSADMIVSVPDQALALVDRGKLIARYSISTSKFGTGDSAASFRTPLGTLFVSAKIGDRLPPGTDIKNRIPTGEIVAVDTPGRARRFTCDLAARNGKQNQKGAIVAFTSTGHEAPDRQTGQLRLHPHARATSSTLRSRSHRHTRPGHPAQASRFR